MCIFRWAAPSWLSILLSFSLFRQQCFGYTGFKSLFIINHLDACDFLACAYVCVYFVCPLNLIWKVCLPECICECVFVFCRYILVYFRMQHVPYSHFVLVILLCFKLDILVSAEGVLHNRQIWPEAPRAAKLSVLSPQITLMWNNLVFCLWCFPPFSLCCTPPLPSFILSSVDLQMYCIFPNTFCHIYCIFLLF